MQGGAEGAHGGIRSRRERLRADLQRDVRAEARRLTAAHGVEGLTPCDVHAAWAYPRLRCTALRRAAMEAVHADAALSAPSCCSRPALPQTLL